jgi:acyl-CoA synthetase (AMP-forming)/AMP-acid ligase II
MEHGSRHVTSGQTTTRTERADRTDIAGPAFSGPTLTTAVLDAIAEHTAGRADHTDRPAVIDTTDGRSLTYAEITSVVPTAGAGLARRGVRTGDIAAVLVPCAREFTLAVHALAAAGAVPAPLPPEATADELADLLTGCGARLLVTAPPLGEVALAAADSSYVRQVFAFGDVPGATPFGELLRGGGPQPHIDPLHDHALIQPTTDPPERLTHADRLADMYRLAAAVTIDADDVVVAAAAGCPEATWAGLIDVALVRGATFAAVTRPGAAPLLRAIETYGATLAIVSPATLQTLAFDGAFAPITAGPLRLLTTGPAPLEAVRACRRRYEWSIDTLA